MIRILKTGILNEDIAETNLQLTTHNLQLLKNRGFTLIELLLVIVVIGIILAVALPKISYFEDISVRKDARKIAGLIRYLNEAASTKKLYYRVSFDMEKAKIRVEYSKDGVEFKDETEPSMKGLSLRGMIEIEDIVLPGLGKINNGEAIVIFSPYGYSEPFNLHLKGAGRFFTLSFNPYTDKVKIEEGYV